MESNHISTDIHQGYAHDLGKVAIKCTADHLWIFKYQTCCASDRLMQLEWKSFKEIRLNVQDGEVKFTMRSGENIRIWLNKPQALIRQMEYFERIVKIRKWKPNLYGMLYYEPQPKNQVYEVHAITEVEFIELVENARKSNTVIPRRFKKNSVCGLLTAFLDNIF